MQAKKYFGTETIKAINNFPITGVKVNTSLISSLAIVKKAAAITNFELKQLDLRRYKAIVEAIDEIQKGDLNDQFVTDSVQGGAGTSINMNMNEVIAARATEIMGNKITIDPLEDVNLSQSTNDVLPSALRLSLLKEVDNYLKVLSELEKSFLQKAKDFKGIIKVGRTHLQDAVPIFLSQEMLAYSAFVKRDGQRLNEIKKYLLFTNLGGTAIGTGINSSTNYIKLVNKNLAKLTGYNFKPAKDLIDATQNTDVFLHISYLIGLSAGGLSKICSDLRLMASGPRAGIGELIIPELQSGSSIMPGKNNPVIFETINQISAYIIGETVANSIALLNGQLELNVMTPVFITTLLNGLQSLSRGVEKLTQTILLLKADKKRCQELLDKSLAYSTILNKYIGYEKAVNIVREALKNKTSIIVELEKSGLLTRKEISKIFSTNNLVYPSGNTVK
jgi:aspartate ammonia-lyase